MNDYEVAFLGLGAMGSGMAKQLVSKGLTVHCFDLLSASVDRLVEIGGKRANNPADAAKHADVIVIMAVNPAQVSSVLFDEKTGAVHGLRQGATVMITSTVPPEFPEEVLNRLHNEFKRPDVVVLDCPVSGGTTGAASGTLTIFSSGPEEALEKARPVLERMSTKLYKVPGGIGSGAKAKVSHQILAEVHIALCNEVMAFAARAGLNTQEAFDFAQSSDGWSWINGNRIPHMLEGDKNVFSALPNSLKDCSIIVNLSRFVYPVPLTAAAEHVFGAGIHAGWAKEDDSTLWRLYLSRYPEDAIHQMTKPGCTLISPPTDINISVEDVNDIFAGSHLAIAVEAIGFTDAVGLDAHAMYKIFSSAAGASTQFIDHVPKMKRPTWSLQDVPEAKSILDRMNSAMDKATRIGAPMPVAAVALQILKQHLQ